jgi:hypothetical protein
MRPSNTDGTSIERSQMDIHFGDTTVPTANCGTAVGDRKWTKMRIGLAFVSWKACLPQLKQSLRVRMTRFLRHGHKNAAPAGEKTSLCQETR